MKDNYKQYFIDILRKYRLGTASPEEVNFLEKYYDLFNANEDLSLTDEDSIRIKDLIKGSIDQELEHHQHIKPRNSWQWVKYAAAASVVLMLSVTLFILLSPRTDKNHLTASANDVDPGGNKAILTLANGKKIVLDDASKGQISDQIGINITKTADGQIVYNVTGDESIVNEPTQNTISTPNGGQYTIVLSDGTKVKLNAASSLTFPNSFRKSDRIVELKGEAYFEVAKQTGKRFQVRSEGQTVEVLGTNFNINAYTNEDKIKTTLLEGSVKVLLGQNNMMINPGQQTLADRTTTSLLKKDIDPEKEVAWINDQFFFDNDNLKSVMREVSRWYDVDVVYTGNIPDKKFFGGIPRSSKLSEVFKILELNNVHFEIKGKTVKVSYSSTP
ncbi:FecR family protein [Pedobacter frigoris]|uniref:FecR family protein n=1 Tax=Pedobacter frigoris TaxID=2571272 RepID=A0A4U1CPB2_9SPHI|nr:FecR family protein [Pedobacter frigoris]TKC09106.1 FecR family protein [Pedobacter frigoris]